MNAEQVTLYFRYTETGALGCLQTTEEHNQEHIAKLVANLSTMQGQQKLQKTFLDEGLKTQLPYLRLIVNANKRT